MTKVLVIVGTTRQGRVGRKVADWYIKQAKKAAPELDFELFDVADEKLELFNEPVSPMYHQYSQTQENLAKKIGAADAYIFVTGEYNHSVPASLKNLIDHLYAEWNHKVAGFVGYGAVGGVRAIEHLTQIMTEVKVASLRDHMTINTIWEALDDNGEPKDGYVHGDINAQLTELTWWANALKAAR